MQMANHLARLDAPNLGERFDDPLVFVATWLQT